MGVTVIKKEGGSSGGLTAPVNATDVADGSVSNTEFESLDGVTSDVQTQLNAKAPIASPTFTGTVSGVTASMVGLGNVTNTSDTNKPVSTAQQTALNLKANLASPTFTGTVSGVTKSHVGLANVDNTSDVNKPVSSATTTQLNLKAPIASPTFTGTVNGITKSMVGLPNVDNTSDANKPVSTAQQTALDGKAATSHTHSTGSITTGRFDDARIPTAFLKVEGSLSRMIGEDGFPPPTITADTTGAYVDYTVTGAGVGRQVKCNVRSPGVSNLIAIGECTATDTVRVYFCTTSGSVDIEEKSIDIMVYANKP